MAVCVHTGHAPGSVCPSSAALKHDKGFHYRCLLGVAVAQCGSFNIIISLLYVLRNTVFHIFVVALRRLCLFCCFHNITKIQKIHKTVTCPKQAWRQAYRTPTSSWLEFKLMGSSYRREEKKTYNYYIILKQTHFCHTEYCKALFFIFLQAPPS